MKRRKEEALLVTTIEEYSGENMRIIIAILIFLFTSNYGYARYKIFFGTETILTKTKDIYSLDIYQNSNIDSIMQELKIINDNYKYYFYINFYGLNEIQLDEFACKFFYRNNVAMIDLYSCPIKVLPLSFREYGQLHSIGFYECHNIESVENVNFNNPIFVLDFSNCNIENLPKGIENWKCMLNLYIKINNDFDKFDLNFSLKRLSRRNNIMNLYIQYEKLKVFPEELFNLTTLRNLVFISNPQINSIRTDRLINLVNVESNLKENHFLEQILLNDLSTYYNFTDTESDYAYSALVGDVFLFQNYRDLIGLYRDEGDKRNDSLRKEAWLKEFNHEPNSSPWKPKYTIDGYEFKFTYNPDDRFFKIKSDDINAEDEVILIIVDSYTSQEFLRIDMKKSEDYTVDLTSYPNIYFDIKYNINGTTTVYKLRIGK